MTGVFLLVMSLSGSVLVFHDEIDRIFFRDQILLNSPTHDLSFDRSFEKIRSANAGWEIRVPVLPNPGEALRYELRKGNLRKWIFVHPEKGNILGTVDRADQRFINILLTLHYSFFAGTPGKIFVAILGVVFLLLLVTGLIIYRKSLVKVLLFRQHFSFKSRRAGFSSLHRWVGVWGLILNLFICITGIRMAYVVASGALKTVPYQINVPTMTHSIDEMIRRAKLDHPEFEVTYLRFPTMEGGNLSLLGHHASDPFYYGRLYSNLALNSQTGAVETMTLLREKPWLDRFMIILQPLHLADYGGIGLKVIYTIAGVLPGVLAISGFVIWTYRVRSKKKKVGAPRKELKTAA